MHHVIKSEPAQAEQKRNKQNDTDEDANHELVVHGRVRILCLRAAGLARLRNHRLLLLRRQFESFRCLRRFRRQRRQLGNVVHVRALDENDAVDLRVVSIAFDELDADLPAADLRLFLLVVQTVARDAEVNVLVMCRALAHLSEDVQVRHHLVITVQAVRMKVQRKSWSKKISSYVHNVENFRVDRVEVNFGELQDQNVIAVA